MLSSRRFHLRQVTAREHQMLDGMVGVFPDLAAYRVYVAAISRFRAAVEQQLHHFAVPREWGPYQTLHVETALRRDRSALGLAEPDDAVFEPGSGPEALLGISYTLEGSNLGARLLYKRAQALGLTEEHGAAHLALQAGSGGGWPRFLDILENASGIDMAKVGEAALATFALARQSFERSAR